MTGALVVVVLAVVALGYALWPLALPLGGTVAELDAAIRAASSMRTVCATCGQRPEPRAAFCSRCGQRTAPVPTP